MPWKIIEKSYGRDSRCDAKYQIRYQSTTLHFDLVCYYLEDGYKWFLNCETWDLNSIILGKSPALSDKQAGPAAVDYLRKVLADKLLDLDHARETFSEQLDREKKRL